MKEWQPMRYLTTTQAAKKLGVTRNWLYTLIAMGKIKAVLRDDAWTWSIPERTVNEYLFAKQENGKANR